MGKKKGHDLGKLKKKKDMLLKFRGRTFKFKSKKYDMWKLRSLERHLGSNMWIFDIDKILQDMYNHNLVNQFEYAGKSQLISRVNSGVIVPLTTNQTLDTDIRAVVEAIIEMHKNEMGFKVIDLPSNNTKVDLTDVHGVGIITDSKSTYVKALVKNGIRITGILEAYIPPDCEDTDEPLDAYEAILMLVGKEDLLISDSYLKEIIDSFEICALFLGDLYNMIDTFPGIWLPEQVISYGIDQIIASFEYFDNLLPLRHADRSNLIRIATNKRAVKDFIDSFTPDVKKEIEKRFESLLESFA